MSPSKSTILVLLQLWCYVLLTGFGANALSYDYTTTIECLAEPHKPQYGGGIIRNPDMKHDLKGWSWFGSPKLQHRVSENNGFIVAHTRNQPHDSMSQKVYLHKNRIYTFSAWVKVSEGSVQVKAMLKTVNGFQFAGDVIAEPNCWSMLKGGLSVNASGPAELYFESKNTSVEIHVDSVSLQPFTHQEWRSHQDQSINKIRKRNVQIKAVDKNGNPMPNATISIQQNKIGFPVGCSTTKNILDNPGFQKWFTSRFTVTTFGDEMKWYSTEGRGRNMEDYTVADNMLRFFQQHNIKVRAHNVFWDDPKYQPYWVSSLSPPQLAEAAKKRQQSIMSRYKGQVIHWDVVNENLHFRFFEDKLGPGFSAEVYRKAREIDDKGVMFLNEYNTLEYVEDKVSSPAMYLKKLREMGSSERMGIGLESHFGPRDPNVAYIRASLDTLGAVGLPIWITELDVESCPQQAQYLEQIMREVYSHPKVNGLVMWAGMGGNGQCYRMCLTDQNFKNLPTGDVVDKLLKEWGLGSRFSGTTDANGFIEASLFEGDYEVKMNKSPSIAQSLKVVSVPQGTSQQETTLFVGESL